jgi:hypothetical protein
VNHVNDPLLVNGNPQSPQAKRRETVNCGGIVSRLFSIEQLQRVEILRLHY